MIHDQDLIAIQEVRGKVEAAYAAWQKYRAYSQAQIDAIVEAMGAAGRQHALDLARIAVEETGYGNVKDKLAKNLLCADLLPRSIRSMKTVGVLREIPEQKVVEIGVPVGIVAAIVPTTNPTSTVIYKSIISLKAGNGIVLSPHPRAQKCTCHTAALMHRAAVEAGAPEGIIQCLEKANMDATKALMTHKRTGVILSTGGSGIVRAAYSSGKPAFGVGPGNVPVLLEKTADIPQAIANVVAGKAFDYGTVCSSEQALVAGRSLREQVLKQLKAEKAHLCNEQQKQALGKLLITPNWTVNPKCVGQAPTTIARMAGFEVPEDTSILVVELDGVGKEHPLSAEKLSPVLSLYFVADFNAAMDTCEAVLRFGGLGHTCVIYSKDEERIRDFGMRMPAMRVLVNTSAPQGSTGITTGILPSMTLGCGALAGNITGDNVGPLHLINTKRIAYAIRKAEDVLRVPDVPQEVSSPVSASGALASVDRSIVISAVEKYLEQRGFPVQSSRMEPEPAREALTAPATASDISNVAADVVERFLKRRSAPAQKSARADCGCADSCPVTPMAQPAPEPSIPQPEVRIVDFVCEADVRAAVQQAKKIFIGPKTIVTPAARELAAQHDTLVMAERS